MKKFIQKITKLPTKDKEEFYYFIKKIIGFSPKNISLYKKAFTHRSANKTDAETGLPLNYERLEFLGDAILGAVITAYLYQEIPEGDEGHLTQMRSKIVSREYLNKLGKTLKLNQFVDSNTTVTKLNNNIYGNIFEALVGSIYLDKGFNACKKFIYKKVINPHIDVSELEGKVTSYKSIFIEWCQKNKKEFLYENFEDSGKDPVKHFSVKLYLNGKTIAKGRATSKKKAEEIASKRAYFALQNHF